MPSNHNWVCFSCHSAIRKPKFSKTVPECLSCGEDCFCLGYKVEIPKKDDTRGWRKLREECRLRALASADHGIRIKAQKKHALEYRIKYLDSLVKNKDRDRLIVQLKKPSTTCGELEYLLSLKAGLFS